MRPPSASRRRGPAERVASALCERVTSASRARHERVTSASRARHQRVTSASPARARRERVVGMPRVRPSLAMSEHQADAADE